MNVIQILPAILSTTPEQYEADIDNLNKASSFSEGWVHIDFMDNKFVPNKSIEPEITENYETPLSKEAHLMVQDPSLWIEKLHNLGFKRVVIHFESDNVEDAVDLAKKRGLEVGIAIKNDTPVLSLEKLVPKIDMILIMGVEPGFQGQPFLIQAIEKIKEIKRTDWKVKVAVDGAVKDSNTKALVQAGVDQLDIGSFLLRGNIDENLEKIWEIINS